jgi:hypothetical protein
MRDETEWQKLVGVEEALKGKLQAMVKVEEAAKRKAAEEKVAPKQKEVEEATEVARRAAEEAKASMEADKASAEATNAAVEKVSAEAMASEDVSKAEAQKKREDAVEAAEAAEKDAESLPTFDELVVAAAKEVAKGAAKKQEAAAARTQRAAVKAAAEAKKKQLAAVKAAATATKKQRAADAAAAEAAEARGVVDTGYLEPLKEAGEWKAFDAQEQWHRVTPVKVGQRVTLCMTISGDGDGSSDDGSSAEALPAPSLKSMKYIAETILGIKRKENLDARVIELIQTGQRWFDSVGVLDGHRSLSNTDGYTSGDPGNAENRETFQPQFGDVWLRGKNLSRPVPRWMKITQDRDYQDPGSGDMFNFVHNNDVFVYGPYPASEGSKSVDQQRELADAIYRSVTGPIPDEENAGAKDAAVVRLTNVANRIFNMVDDRLSADQIRPLLALMEGDGKAAMMDGEEGAEVCSGIRRCTVFPLDPDDDALEELLTALGMSGSVETAEICQYDPGDHINYFHVDEDREFTTVVVLLRAATEGGSLQLESEAQTESRQHIEAEATNEAEEEAKKVKDDAVKAAEDEEERANAAAKATKEAKIKEAKDEHEAALRVQNDNIARWQDAIARAKETVELMEAAAAASLEPASADEEMEVVDLTELDQEAEECDQLEQDARDTFQEELDQLKKRRADIAERRNEVVRMQRESGGEVCDLMADAQHTPEKSAPSAEQSISPPNAAAGPAAGAAAVPAVTILVISMDSDVGRDRLGRFTKQVDEHLGADIVEVTGYTFADVPEDFRAKMRFMPNKKDVAHKQSQTAIAYSHYRALQRGAEIDGPVIICEDDAWLRFRITDTVLTSLATSDAATLLAGTLAHPTKLAADFNPAAIVKAFTNGINEIDYTRFRWWGQVAIHYPAGVIPRLITALDALRSWGSALDRKIPDLCSDMATELNRPAGRPHFRARKTDGETPFVKYLLYPAPFDHNDLGVSQNVSLAKGNKKGSGFVRDYAEVEEHGYVVELSEKNREQVAEMATRLPEFFQTGHPTASNPTASNSTASNSTASNPTASNSTATASNSTASNPTASNSTASNPTARIYRKLVDVGSGELKTHVQHATNRCDSDFKLIFNESSIDSEGQTQDNDNTRLMLKESTGGPTDLVAIKGAVEKALRRRGAFVDGEEMAAAALLRSLAGGAVQHKHRDYDPMRVEKLRVKTSSVFVAFQDGMKLWVAGQSEPIVLAAGDGLKLDGDAIHCGWKYGAANTRFFAYIDTNEYRIGDDESYPLVGPVVPVEVVEVVGGVGLELESAGLDFDALSDAVGTSEDEEEVEEEEEEEEGEEEEEEGEEEDG